MNPFEVVNALLLLLAAPAMIFGIALGVCGALLLHCFGPSPEPFFIGALLIALGFVGGAAATWWLEDSKRSS